jgi:hypothetical protein
MHFIHSSYAESQWLSNIHLETQHFSCELLVSESAV